MRWTAIIISAAAFAGGSARAETGCTKCHSGVESSPAHAALLASHAASPLSCVACHRGDEQSTEAAGAHAAMLAKDRVSAACARCHVPGAVPGMEPVVAGAQFYLELGCQFCHKSERNFGYVAAFAPPIAGIAARGSAHLEKVLREPGSLYPGTVMPAYARELERQPERGRALVTYLLSLGGEDSRKPIASAARCSSCHAQKNPIGGSKHRCRLIRDAAAELSCRRCHAKGVPAGEAECLYIRERRRDCGVCHQGGVDGQ